MPPLLRGGKGELQVPRLQIVAQLDISSADLLHGFTAVLVQGQPKNPPPLVKVGLYPQVALAEGDKHREVSNPMRRQVMEPHPEVAEKPLHKGCAGALSPMSWKGMKEMTCDSLGTCFITYRSSRSHPVEGRISHARAISSISPSAFDESHSTISNKQEQRQTSSVARRKVALDGEARTRGVFTFLSPWCFL